jgi:methanethiol S-methyltransferase
MLKRLLILIYAIQSYTVFTASFLYGIGFVGNFLVSKTIDVGGDADLPEAVVVDLFLLVLFAIQHSVMARLSFKRRFDEWLPPACQRSTYVLLSSLRAHP